jgi:integrase
MDGLTTATEEAYTLSRQLARGQFAWKKWIKSQNDNSVEFWRSRLQEIVMSRSKVVTWKKDYGSVLNKLPDRAEISYELLKRLILDTEPNTRTRKRTVNVANQLSRIAGFDYDFSQFKGNYSIQQADYRSIPTDEMILEEYKKIDSAEDRWIFGILCTYGIRNHEIFYLDLDNYDGDALTILDGKTGSHIAFPYQYEWVKEFRLTESFPQESNAARNDCKGQIITNRYRKLQIPWRPYDGRHAYAIRALKAGVQDSNAARMMGHSLLLHTQTYQHWITLRDQQAMVNQLRSRY